MRKLCSILVMTQLALTCAPMAVIAAPTEQSRFDQAMREYGARDYQRAADDLEVLLGAHPENATAHYLLGCCWTQLKDLDSARDEYRNAIKYDKSGKIVPVATQALNSVYCAIQSIAAKNAAVTNTLAVIHAQADSGTQIEKQVDDARFEQEEQTQLGGDVRKYGPVYSGTSPISQNYMENAIRQHKEFYDSERKKRAEGAPRYWSGLTQAADDLAEQLQQNSGSVRLVPSQTNLYLRTYATAPSAPAKPAATQQTKLPEQLAADQDQLILQPVKNKLVSHVVPAPLAAGQDKLFLHNNGGKDDKSRDLAVFGRITHK